MSLEHPFAQYVRILGKGKKGSRSLTQEEARDAMQMIIRGEVEPEQLGAFMMLLRVKEEAPEELAGFVSAVRSEMHPPQDLRVDIDWSTYAGKKRQLPWFLLSALALADAGYRVFMHGARGHTHGRMYTQEMLAMFGLEACQDWQQSAAALDRDNFAFMSIEQLSPKMSKIINLRNIMGLRSPVHTLCRLLNPLHAEHTVDGVFHPAYGPMHQKTAMLLGVKRGLTIKGDGGEAEIKPDSDCDLQWTFDGEYQATQWPRYYPRRLVKQELSLEALPGLWRGEVAHEYGEGAVISTLATVLQLLSDQAPEQSDAADYIARAEQIWANRNKQRFNG
ncbi:glycosyl transferase family protein [Aliamphritea hakodatensis]|uniref:glycosyl transferase family protein n=1 Tax=Aliamphritea hakodatensis TaxID=2895352 RepID=UPI0022FD76B8|nr:glycosyl transferase family protein [Aliamphritea hakodatensis]